MLVNGKWTSDWPPVQAKDEKGGFVRQTSSFRNWVTPDGSAYQPPHSGASRGRRDGQYRPHQAGLLFDKGAEPDRYRAGWPRSARRACGLKQRGRRLVKFARMPARRNITGAG